MALTSKEQTKVIQLLGYGAKTIQAGSVIYNKILNDRLHNLQPDTEDLVREYLTKIAALEVTIDAAPARFAVKKLEDIEFNTGEVGSLRAERKRWARELSSLLDIPMLGGGSGVNVSMIS